MEMPQPSCSVKPHCFGMPSSPTTCPASTHTFCWNKQVRIKWAEPGGRFLSAIYREKISYLCKCYFKASNFWGGKDPSQASVKQARSDLQKGKKNRFVLQFCRFKVVMWERRVSFLLTSLYFSSDALFFLFVCFCFQSKESHFSNK